MGMYVCLLVHANLKVDVLHSAWLTIFVHRQFAPLTTNLTVALWFKVDTTQRVTMDGGCGLPSVCCVTSCSFLLLSLCMP